MKTTSKWLRRLGAGVLAVLLLVGLCACGGDDTTVTTTTADVTTTTEAANVTTTTAGEDTETTTTETAEAEDTTTAPVDPTEVNKVTDATTKAPTTTKAPVTTTKAPTKATTTKAPTKATTTKAPVTTTKAANKTALTLDQVMANMPANLRGTTINFFLWEDLNNMPIGAAFKKFTQDSGINVKFDIANYESYSTQLAGKITSGASPDVVYVQTNNIGDVKNLQPFTNSGYDISTNDWDHEISKQFTFNGRTYAVSPANSPSHNLLIVEYSKLAVKKAKLDDPWEMYQKDPSWWTWDKFFELCDTFLEKTGRRNGYFGSNLGGESYVRCFGGGLSRYNPDKGKYESLVNSPETVKRFEILLDAIEKNWSTSSSDGTSFKQGKILFSTSFSSKLEKGHPYYEGESVGYMPIPTDSKTNAVFTFVTCGIPVGAKNKEAVPYMVRYCYSPETCPDFFVNKDAEKIVMDMVKRGNYFFSNGWNYQIWTDMLAGTSSQVKAICDKYAPEYEGSAADANAELANLPK